ncbi:MAG: hypothetical protein WCI11_06245 [Candidatus Methylumidiphilus sp.]
MSVNKYKPHVLVLPEDDADRQIANGFCTELGVNHRNIQILPEVGGWKIVVEVFTKVHALEMRKLPYRSVVLLIDFDGHINRLDEVRQQIPEELNNRVFILGVLSEPEELKKSTGKSFEYIGRELAHNCVNGKDGLWEHDLLKHNNSELERMIKLVKSFLFDKS